MTIQQELVLSQGLLEQGTHEDVTGATLGEESEVHPEEAQVHDGGQEYEASRTPYEMPIEVLHGVTFLSDVEDLPEIDEDCGTDGGEGK